MTLQTEMERRDIPGVGKELRDVLDIGLEGGVRDHIQSKPDFDESWGI